MGLFDFFKPKKKNENKYFETEDFGTFVFEPELDCWEKYDPANDLYYYINKNTEKPHQIEIDFLKNINKQIENLDSKINEKIISLYDNDEYLNRNFNHWKDKFCINYFEVLRLDENNYLWNLCIRKNNMNDEDYHIDFIITIENDEVKNILIDD